MARACEVEDGRHDSLPDLPRPFGAAVRVQEHQQLARPVAALPDGRVQCGCPVTHRLGRLRTHMLGQRLRTACLWGAPTAQPRWWGSRACEGNDTWQLATNREPAQMLCGGHGETQHGPRTGDEKTRVRGFQRHIFLALRPKVCTTSRYICAREGTVSFQAAFGLEMCVSAACAARILCNIAPSAGSLQPYTT